MRCSHESDEKEGVFLSATWSFLFNLDFIILLGASRCKRYTMAGGGGCTLEISTFILSKSGPKASRKILLVARYYGIFIQKFSTFNIWTSPIFKTATTFFENSKFSSYSFAMFKCITFHSSLQFSTIILQNFYSFSEFPIIVFLIL